MATPGLGEVNHIFNTYFIGWGNFQEKRKGAEKTERRDIYHTELFIEYLPHLNSLQYNYY